MVLSKEFGDRTVASIQYAKLYFGSLTDIETSTPPVCRILSYSGLMLWFQPTISKFV